MKIRYDVCYLKKKIITDLFYAAWIIYTMFISCSNMHHMLTIYIVVLENMKVYF
jgi:hypothetical protein